MGVPNLQNANAPANKWPGRFLCPKGAYAFGFHRSNAFIGVTRAAGGAAQTSLQTLVADNSQEHQTHRKVLDARCVIGLGLTKSDEAQQSQNGDPAADGCHYEYLCHCGGHGRFLFSVVLKRLAISVPTPCVWSTIRSIMFYHALRRITNTSRTSMNVEPLPHDARKQHDESTQIFQSGTKAPISINAR